jgi:hypothetical protein
MLFKLLGLPVTLPAAGIKFCFQQVLNAAEAEYTDPGPVKEQLLLLQLQLEEGEITEEEYVEREAALFQRLREIKAYQERKLSEQMSAQSAGQGGSGAVIQYHGDQPSR